MSWKSGEEVFKEIQKKMAAFNIVLNKVLELEKQRIENVKKLADQLEKNDSNS